MADGVFSAARARIALEHLGPAVALDAEATRLAMGPTPTPAPSW